ncbi:hypothetical protein SLEP1_g7644 [Rubroshorea leprosula]|uniref:Uncharacterized protein n=1 Tax=Rubroshorea leprosula TaxID=152421 RepID=A0AAV5I744_9ROSI|nr:hypothetical protein SLEP1_g7644 [Rubroshorea leprosula]
MAACLSCLHSPPALRLQLQVVLVALDFCLKACPKADAGRVAPLGARPAFYNLASVGTEDGASLSLVSFLIAACSWDFDINEIVDKHGFDT